MKPIVLLLLLIISVYAWQQEAEFECPAALPHVCEDEIGPSCVNFESDFQHCGECDHKCKDNETCVKGECACTCSNAINACGSSSINCGTTPLTPDCINGACACRNTNTACSSVGCKPCPPPQVCDATGVCNCCKVTGSYPYPCAQCSPSQTTCRGNSGACCLLSGNTGCTSNSDCCTGLSCINGPAPRVCM